MNTHTLCPSPFYPNIPFFPPSAGSPAFSRDRGRRRGIASVIQPGARVRCTSVTHPFSTSSPSPAFLRASPLQRAVSRALYEVTDGKRALARAKEKQKQKLYEVADGKLLPQKSPYKNKRALIKSLLLLQDEYESSLRDMGASSWEEADRRAAAAMLAE